MLSQQQRIVGSTSKRVKSMAGHVTQRVESGPYHPKPRLPSLGAFERPVLF